MSANDDSIRALRDALRFSPENIPLRQHLADSLLQHGRIEEAIEEFREALSRDGASVGLKLGLAGAYFAAGKDSHAMVIVEDLLRMAEVPAKARLLHARLLLRAGDIQRAVSQYRGAIEDDPQVADRDLAELLGIGGEGEVVEGRVRSSWEEAPPPRDASLERPAVNFSDVGGMDPLKEEIRMKIIYPLTHADLFKSYGKAIGGGILLYGPPGCGKTYLARATAGEIKANFISVGLNDVLEMWVGSSERNLHQVFDSARGNTPCVMFFDEVDALAASRSDFRHSSARQVINQFLAEMDGVNTSNDGVLILAATNAPWHLDSAFRRPGRFDRILFVPPPDAVARSVILRLMCRGKPVEKIDFDLVAKKTEDFSGADLKAVIDVAIENKLREAMTQGKPLGLSTADLVAAARGVRPSTKEWFSTARNYALYSNQSGAYDDILKYLKM